MFNIILINIIFSFSHDHGTGFTNKIPESGNVSKAFTVSLKAHGSLTMTKFLT